MRTIYILFMVTISRNHLRQPGNQHFRDTHPSDFFHKSEISFGNHFLRTIYILFIVPISKNQLRQLGNQYLHDTYPSSLFQILEITYGNQATLFCGPYTFFFFGPNFQKSAKETRQPKYAQYLFFCFFSEIRNKLRQPGNQVLRTIYILLFGHNF